MLKSQDNKDISKLSMLVKSTILHSKLFHIAGILSMKNCLRTFGLDLKTVGNDDHG